MDHTHAQAPPPSPELRVCGWVGGGGRGHEAHEGRLCMGIYVCGWNAHQLASLTHGACAGWVGRGRHYVMIVLHSQLAPCRAA